MYLHFYLEIGIAAIHVAFLIIRVFLGHYCIYLHNIPVSKGSIITTTTRWWTQAGGSVVLKVATVHVTLGMTFRVPWCHLVTLHSVSTPVGFFFQQKRKFSQTEGLTKHYFLSLIILTSACFVGLQVLYWGQRIPTLLVLVFHYHVYSQWEKNVVKIKHH